MPCRASLAVAIGFPSSLTATIPACCIAAISAIASPLLPALAAPMGQTRTLAHVFARSRMNRVTLALSFTGFVFGMQQTAVNPPRAAAFVPVSMVSEDSCPGSRRCAWRSIKPGATICPPASNPRLRCFTARLRVLFAVAGTQQEEQRHSHRNAVGYLVQHTRLRTVGDLWRNFNAAVHRPGMQHNRIPLGTAEPLAI